MDKLSLNSTRAPEVPPERLASNHQLTEKQKVGEASRQFEAVLLRQILSTAQKPHFKSTVNSGGASNEIYRDLVTEQLADGISKSGALGVSKMLTAQMAKNLPGEKHATALKHGVKPDASAVKISATVAAKAYFKGGAAGLMGHH